MATTSNIAWKPIAYCAGTLVLGLAVGALLIGPALEKRKQKKKQAEEA